MKIDFSRELRLIAMALVALAIFAPASGVELPEATDVDASNVRKVFEDIVRVAGVVPAPPKLHLYEGTRTQDVAFWYPSGVIKVNTRLAALLREKIPGRELDALAVIVGHELAHHYRQHNWVRTFGFTHADHEIGQDIKAIDNPQDALRAETEADDFGLFYAYLAGYETADVAQDTLQVIYDTFGLSDRKLAIYPSQTDRIAIAQRAATKLSSLKDVFQLGVYFLVADQPGRAKPCFEHILKEFPSPAVRINLGIALCQQAMALRKDANADLATYPLAIDLDSRLPHRPPAGAAGRDGDDDATRLIEEAVRHFTEAGQQDPGNPAVEVNLASAKTMQEDYLFAKAHLQRAEKLIEAKGLDSKPMQSLMRVLGSIIAFRSDKNTDALVWLDDLALEGSELARVNAAVLRGQEVEPLDVTNAVKRESLLGLSADRAGDATVGLQPVYELVMKNVGGQKSAIFGRYKDGPMSVLELDLGRVRGVVLETSSPEEESFNGIKVGQTRDEVEASMGRPTSVWPQGAGTVLYYHRADLAVSFGHGDQVASWAIVGE